jgi:protein gp37
MLEGINTEAYLSCYGNVIESVSCGGESGEGARVCDYDWILWMREQCMRYNVNFGLRQTGANFRKDGKIYAIPRGMQIKQAAKADINFRKQE